MPHPRPILSLLLCLCATVPAIAAGAVSPEARALHERLLTLDTHLDTTALLDDPEWDVLHEHAPSNSQVDYPRMVEGGLDGGFWVVYTPQRGRTADDHRVARDHGLRRLINIHKMVAAHPDRFGLALSAGDVRRVVAAGRRAVLISMENATPLATDPVPLLRFYHGQGLRMLSLVHTANNEFADSATASPEWNGLSPAGRALVAEANRLGVILDQSHASDEAFDDLLELSRAPIVLSHSAAADVHDHPRNIDDERLRRLAARGGVIHVNSLGDYLLDTGRTPAFRAELQAERARLASQPAGPARDQALADVRARLEHAHGVRPATIEDYFRHLAHILEVVGPDHVGIGADWDGGGGVAGFEDITAMPKITQWLLDRGYSEAQIGKIWSGNILRVLDEVQRVATMLQAEERGSAR